MLEIKNINVEFKNQKVLNDLSLSIEEGCILGILGKNGAGKTTLFETLYQSLSFSGNINWKMSVCNGSRSLIWKRKTIFTLILPEKNICLISPQEKKMRLKK